MYENILYLNVFLFSAIDWKGDLFSVKCRLSMHDIMHKFKTLHKNYYQLLLPSSIPITKTCTHKMGYDIAMFDDNVLSHVRDIHDARRIPIERRWVALYL